MWLSGRGYSTWALHAEINGGAEKVKLISMPPKRKLVAGQTRLTYCLTTTPGVPGPSSAYSSDSSNNRRGELESWRKFAEQKWKECFPWITIKDDGVYCCYCQAGMASGVSRSGSEVYWAKVILEQDQTYYPDIRAACNTKTMLLPTEKAFIVEQKGVELTILIEPMTVWQWMEKHFVTAYVAYTSLQSMRYPIPPTSSHYVHNVVFVPNLVIQHCHV